ncbi:DoxX family protein [Muriicola sp. Z0-33]|uniref:DoxX family protein n=1 Tax=Muriicola sp. Z0-33 TaxID=2816957 RepID=UPI002236FDA4|nr:DoxX family protein [Muriicola sp. Z0-33]MCW5516936.1 DoxX family membrane protein [Muriicola sp. Z0-33]
MNSKIIKLFLRISVASAFLSAVADRFGYWPTELSGWGNWQSFLVSTKDMNPWFPETIIPFIATIATGAEIVFAICILIGLKTELFAKLSGILLLLFAISITLSSNIKGAFDYSVFTASAAAFALSMLGEKYLELDLVLFKGK